MEQQGSSGPDPPLVGRSVELAELGELVDRLAGGEPVCGVIEGEPGMGRSSLWRQGLAAGRACRCRVLCCRPAGTDRVLPFGGLIDLLDGVTEPVRELPDPQRHVLEVATLRRDAGGAAPAPPAVGVAVVSLLRRLAAAGPVLVAVDDLQWLDAETTAVLSYAVRRVGPLPVGLLVTVPDGDLSALGIGAGPGADGTDGPRPCRIVPRPLGPAELRRLLLARAGVALARPALVRLERASRGNPGTALRMAHERVLDGSTGVGTPRSGGSEGRSRRLAAAGRCCYSAGDCAEAGRLLEEAVAAAPDGAARADALGSLAIVLANQRGPRAGLTALDAALPAAAGDPPVLARLRLRVAVLAEHDLDRRRDAVRALVGADLPDELAPVAGLVAAYLGFLAGEGLDRAVLAAAHQRVEDGTWEAWIARTVRDVLTAVVDPGTARPAWRGALEQARARGDEGSVPRALFHLARAEWQAGRWAAALRCAEELAEAVEQTGQYRWRGPARAVEGLVAAHLGDAATARTAARAGLVAADQAADPGGCALNHAALGFLELSEQHPRTAHQHLERAAELVRATGVREPEGWFLDGDRVEAALGCDRADHAEALVTELRRRCALAPYPWLLAVTERGQAQLAMATGRLDEAHAAITRALRAHRRLPAPFERARTQLVHGQVLRRRRQRRAAEQVLRQAEAEFTRLGAVLWAPRATAELRRLGLRRGHPDRLTPAEQQVARLAAAGQDNQQIAAVLHISRRTVENHLSRVYRKVGVGSRRELTDRLAGGTAAG